MPVAVSTELFGKPMRWYVDQAEWPWVSLSLAVSAAYVGSFWLEVSYLTLMMPLTLILQVAAGVVMGYLVGVRRGATLGQAMLASCMVAFGGGLVAAVWALIRFWYPWLVLNLIAEPVWSALLGALVSAGAVGFFHLPRLANRLRAVFQTEA